MNNALPWTMDEDSYLIRTYPTMKPKQIAHDLNRSVRAIYNRAQVLELQSRTRIKYRKYSEITGEDKLLMKALYSEGLTIDEIGRKFDAARGVVLKCLEYDVGAIEHIALLSGCSVEEVARIGL